MTFQYIAKMNVGVTVDGIPVPSTWLNAQVIKTATASAVGSVLKVFRTTLSSSPVVDFVDGSTLTEQELYLAARQAHYLAQEAKDVADAALGPDASGAAFNFRSLRHRGGRPRAAYGRRNSAVDREDGCASYRGPRSKDDLRLRRRRSLRSQFVSPVPQDDCLYALEPTIPHLTRSSLHRCLQRHGISRLPDVESDKPKRSKVKAYPIGYFHIDIAQVSTEQGKLHLFVAIDRTSKIAFVRLYEKATQRIAAAFPHDLIAVVPYTIHTVLTDKGIQFTDNKPVDEATEAKAEAYWATQDGPRLYRWHSFEWACEQTKIEHRLTKPRCPWTNGQVERMNRTIKDATVKRYHYESHDELRHHLQLFVDAYNYGRRLKTLRGLTPYEFVCQAWTKQPERFRIDPSHHTAGPNI